MISAYHNDLDKLKFKIKDQKITAKTELERLKLKLFGKKKHRSIFGAYIRFIGYHRVSLLILTISGKTWLLFTKKFEFEFYFKHFVQLLLNLTTRVIGNAFYFSI